MELNPSHMTDLTLFSPNNTVKKQSLRNTAVVPKRTKVVSHFSQGGTMHFPKSQLHH